MASVLGGGGKTAFIGVEVINELSPTLQNEPQ